MKQKGELKMADFLNEFIKPELLVLVPVLYLIGIWLKKSVVKDKFIPLILGAVGIALSAVWVLATSQINTWQNVLLAFFTAVTQGILTAGTSVYCNQLIKQAKKSE